MMWDIFICYDKHEYREEIKKCTSKVDALEIPMDQKVIQIMECINNKHNENELVNFEFMESRKSDAYKPVMHRGVNWEDIQTKMEKGDVQNHCDVTAANSTLCYHCFEETYKSEHPSIHFGICVVRHLGEKYNVCFSSNYTANGKENFETDKRAHMYVFFSIN